MKIIGIEKIRFEAKDGQIISGKRFHTGEDIPADRGTGQATDRFFMSDGKLANLNFEPAVGNVIQIYFNRYGKVASMSLVDDLIDLG